MITTCHVKKLETLSVFQTPESKDIELWICYVYSYTTGFKQPVTPELQYFGG